MATILIVDDDPTIRMVATELLRAEDHAIVEASDGVEAVRLAAAMPIDLIVVDMLMPNKDGLETILEVRQTRPAARILAISGGGSIAADELLRTAMVFGAHATLAKPLRVETFARTIRELLDPQSGARRGAVA